MFTAGGVKQTTEAGVRLRPEAIYQLASTRDEALSLLRRYGYIR
jgi:hypothetical protein